MKSHEEFDIYKAIENLARILPHQGPIKDFIHQNTLSAFMDLPFDDAVKQAGDIMLARSYMDLSFYRDKFFTGLISKHQLDEALTFYLPKNLNNEIDFFYDALMNFKSINHKKTLQYLAAKHNINFDLINQQLSTIISIKGHVTKKTRIFTEILNNKLGNHFEHEIHQLLFRLLASFVDQGVSLWPYLNNGSSFLKAVEHLAQTSSLGLKSWINNKELAYFLALDPKKSIPQLLSFLVDSPKLYYQYLQELLLAHPGWSGMINVIAHHPQSLSKKSNIDLIQVVTLKLALSWQYIKNKAPTFKAISTTEVSEQEKIPHKKDLITAFSIAWFLCSRALTPSPSLSAIKLIDQHWLEKVWHRAFEYSYYCKVSHIISSKKTFTTSNTYSFQAIFCIDDRECSFRRILEHECCEIETFGTAGFFGIDCYLKTGDLLAQQICPAPLSPKHLIQEQAKPASVDKKTKALVEMAAFITSHGANSTALGFVSAYTLGHLSLFSLMMSLFHPLSLRQSKQRASNNERQLLFERSADTQAIDGLFHGYTETEMADRVYKTLKNIGLSQNFAPIIFIIGHGSSSVNNPHFAAYDCGACSGRPGAINARVFAAMANKAAVRQLLADKGLSIPKESVFVAAFHDTCIDQVEFLDTNDLGSTHQDLLKKFSIFIENTCKKNAQERCQKFALVAKNISQENALKEVRHRASALFEPRPELNHANNALLIVGRRTRSYGTNLDRRAFLQSYNPLLDPDGSILNALLSAVIPVCGGINLEYYFSRIDPAVYGCGSKLSHNVSSLIGVGNGLDDDLRTGLPVQMTEIHDPIRLLIIIEQEQDLIKNIIYNNDIIKTWVHNNWVQLASLNPHSSCLSFFNPKDLSWHLMEGLPC